MTLQPRAVVVHRRTELDELLERHGTRGQAQFFLETRDRSLDEVDRRHAAVTEARAEAAAGIPVEWRRAEVERSDLDRFLFEPEDIVIVVGQDGLVANVAKYLAGQVVIGIDPEPDRNAGVLVRHAPQEGSGLLRAVERGEATAESRAMVEAALDDGQVLVALNEVFVGHPSHQSARYRVSTATGEEPQSSSGLIASTGTGATGWGRSIWQQSKSALDLPLPEERRLVWFVREAWPSRSTGATAVEGELGEGETLLVTAETDGLVAFGDGIELDRLTMAWGQRVELRLSKRRLRLV